MLFYIKRMPKSADLIADSNADSYTDVKCQQKKLKLKQISIFGAFSRCKASWNWVSFLSAWILKQFRCRARCGIRCGFISFETWAVIWTSFSSKPVKKLNFVLFYIIRMPKNADSIADLIADSNAESKIDAKCQLKKLKLTQISTFGYFLDVKLLKIEFLSFQCGF